ncbi:MAG TPA: hypothetical protein VF865_12475 [Acidobacteriaceae bacterium]
MGDRAPRKRIFIVDHMCVLPYGHAQASVALFRRTLGEHFSESHALVPNVLSARSAKERGFTRSLNYPYNVYIYRRFDFLLNRCLRSKWLRVRLQDRLGLIEGGILRWMIGRFGFDGVLWNTERNWEKQFKRYSFGSDDLLFFPSADFYGAAACLDLLLKGKIRNPPRLHLRMIGVMENTCLGSKAACDLLLERVKKATAQGIDVRLSAETPAYASYLAEKLGAVVTYFPQPLGHDSVPMPATEPRIAASMGSARRDKGYFLMMEIVRKTAHRCGNRVVFEIQSMPFDDDAFSSEYESELVTLPNSRVLPAVMEEGEMLELFRRSYVAVLPYDAVVYKHRGSAILQEAIAFTRPVVCLGGAAFAPLVGRYKNGAVCRDVDGVAAAIEECASISPSEWDKRLAVSRRLYERDVEDAIARVLAEP